jgi:hypothetical protein
MARQSITVFSQDLNTIELPVLYDLLATYTAQYTHMMNAVGSEEEYHQLKEAILKLQAEINLRQKKEKR